MSAIISSKDQKTDAVLDALFQLSTVLSCGLTKKQISIVLALLEQGKLQFLKVVGIGSVCSRLKYHSLFSLFYDGLKLCSGVSAEALATVISEAPSHVKDISKSVKLP